MSNDKKILRQQFRESVFKRDNFKCRMCFDSKCVLDAHHITDRNLMPNGGYVKENGISLCPECHIKAELFHSTGTAHPGYSPDDLYIRINSSHEQAISACEKEKHK